MKILELKRAIQESIDIGAAKIFDPKKYLQMLKAQRKSRLSKNS